jgi:phenylalanyl-tRNA synthetase beta chain
MWGLEKAILEKLDIKNKEVFVLELSLERLLFYVNLDKKFSHLAVYPGITRDISFVLKENILAGDVLEAIKQEGKPLLKEAGVTDYYKGKQIPAGFRGLTISCFYRSQERTLTEAEITPLHARVCRVLADKFSAQIR